MDERHTYELRKGGVLYPSRLGRRLPWAPRTLLVSGDPFDLMSPGLAVVSGGDAAVGSAVFPLAMGGICAQEGATLYTAAGDQAAIAAARACADAGGRVVLVSSPRRSYRVAEEAGLPGATILTWGATTMLARQADPETLVSSALAGTVASTGDDLPVLCAGTRTLVGPEDLSAVERVARALGEATRERTAELERSFQAGMARAEACVGGDESPLEVLAGHLVEGRVLVREIPWALLWLERDDAKRALWLVCKERRDKTGVPHLETVLLSPEAGASASALSDAVLSLPGGTVHARVSEALDEPELWKSSTRAQVLARADDEAVLAPDGREERLRGPRAPELPSLER